MTQKQKEQRRKQLTDLFEGIEEENIVFPLIDEVVFLEDRLDYLRTLPMIIVNDQEPHLQRPTTASKQYKDFLQQYNNCIKTLEASLRRSQGEEESPLREFLKQANMER